VALLFHHSWPAILVNRSRRTTPNSALPVFFVNPPAIVGQTNLPQHDVTFP